MALRILSLSPEGAPAESLSVLSIEMFTSVNSDLIHGVGGSFPGPSSPHPARRVLGLPTVLASELGGLSTSDSARVSWDPEGSSRGGDKPGTWAGTVQGQGCPPSGWARRLCHCGGQAGGCRPAAGPPSGLRQYWLEPRSCSLGGLAGPERLRSPRGPLPPWGSRACSEALLGAGCPWAGRAATGSGVARGLRPYCPAVLALSYCEGERAGDWFRVRSPFRILQVRRVSWSDP